MAGASGSGVFRFFVLRKRVLITALVMGVAAVAAGYLARQGTRAPLEVLGQRQRALEMVALRGYAARGEQGALVPQTDAVIAISEQFLQRVIERSLPLRHYFKDGQYVARLDGAKVRLESGLAVVTLQGRGMRSGLEDSPLFADLYVAGLLNVIGIDPDRGTMQASLMITDVRAQRAGPQDMQTLLNPVARYFGGLKAKDWNRNRQRIHLPLRLDHEILLPALDGDVVLAESRIPISVRVSAVTTLEHRMAVSLAFVPDSMGDHEPLGPEKATRVRRAPRRSLESWRGPELRRGERVAADEESLRAQVARLASSDPLWRGVVASDHDVVAIIPAPVLSAVLARASRRYLSGVGVDIHPTKLVDLDQAIRVKILGNRLGVGRIKGSILISHLKGRLTLAGEPSVAFEPPSGLVVTAPIRIVDGRGTVTMDMVWDPAFLVGLVCGSFEFHERLVGEILPFRDDLTMRMHYTIRDSSIEGRMRVQRDVIRFSPDLTEASWNKVLAGLVEQDRFTRCGVVMNPDSVLMKLKGLARRGVKIRLPATLFKPFQLPVVLESQYTAGDYRIEASAFDPAIEVGPDHLRIAFRANLHAFAKDPVANGSR